jgi:hypothetical protein
VSFKGSLIDLLVIGERVMSLHEGSKLLTHH